MPTSGERKTPFDVGVENKDIKTGSEETEEVDVREGESIVVDSPKELWDAIGHVQRRYVVGSDTEVLAAVADAVRLWNTLRELYADDIAFYRDRANESQVSLLHQLYTSLGEEVPEDLYNLNKWEASKLIDELQEEVGEENKPAPRARSSSSRRSSGRSTSRRSSRSSGRSSSRRSSGRSRRSSGGDGKMTNNQRDLLEDLLDEAGEDIPADFDDWTFEDADKEIKALLGK